MKKDDVIRDFCQNKDILNNEAFKAFIDIEELKLQGYYFIGVNVKVDSKDSIRPVICNNIRYQSFNTEHGVGTTIGGTIPNMLSLADPKKQSNIREITYTCDMKNPLTINVHGNIVIRSIFGGDRIIDKSQVLCKEDQDLVDFLSSPDYNSRSTFIADVLNQFTIINCSGPFRVWMYLVDFDINNLGQPLSYILVITENNETLDSIRTQRSAVIMDYIMMAKSIKLKKLADQREREAIKSAKAAIMSRNMSHNLGSHVMFYIKQKLESAPKILQNGVLKDLVTSSSLEDIKEKIKKLGDADDVSEIKGNIENFPTSLGEEMPFLVGLGRFLNYLQERQDYIATVATDYIPYPSVVSFKDAIYDELKPELRCERHNGEAVGRKASNLLLKYIAYSEGFNDSASIVLQFQDAFRGLEDVPADLRTMNVNLPSGTLGRQAFFSIMENIIRNTAKHDGSKVGKSPLVFRFDLLEPNAEPEKEEAKMEPDRFSPVNDKYFYFTGNENLDKKEVESAYKNHGNDYYYLGITIVLGHDATDTVKHIGKALKKKYLTEDGQMDDSCKGIKEIRLSAAWIRGMALDTDISENEPPAVSVRLCNGNLQYIICLPKPKKVAFVLFDHNFGYGGAIKEYETTHKEIVENALYAKGSKVFVPDVVRPENGTRQVIEEKVFSDSLIKQFVDFDLIVLDSRIETKNKNKIRSIVNSRVFEPQDFNETMRHIYDATDVAFGKTVVNEAEAQNYLAKFVGQVYHEWLKTTFGKDNEGEPKPIPQLVINDGKAHMIKFPNPSTDDEQNATNGADKSKYDEDLLNEKLVLCNSSDTDIQPGQLVYSKHYSGQDDLKERYNQAGFLEGVSGGNSTDRLIRQDEWNREWYVKQMAAAMTKVAVIDERIFAKFVRQPDNLWTIETMKDWLKKMKEITDYGKSGFYTKFNEVVGTMFPSLISEDWDPLYNFANNTINIEDENGIKTLLKKIPTDPIDFSVANINAQKGVWAFNIAISNLHEANANNSVPTVSVLCYSDNQIVEVAKFTKIGNEIKTIPEEQPNSDWKKFDFISIHQGVLDKIYGAWNIKSGETDDERKRAREEKESVIRAIFNCFSTQTPVYIDEKHEFLPQFIIHSGRSKPNTGDMPQHQPFIQFAAIEHAINDCKYTLTELLYTAHYEE